MINFLTPPVYQPPTLSGSKHRIEVLDSLRGIAALSVVLIHLIAGYQRYTGRVASLSWPYGAYGVHLFFLISGFVIFMTVEKAKRPVDFVISRFSRLYPPYWVAIALVAVLLILFPVPEYPNPTKVLKRAAVSLTMLQDWLLVGSIDGVSWTLQVEMSFYLVMLVLIWRQATSRIMTVMTVWVALALADHLVIPRPLPLSYAYFRGIFILEYAYLFAAGIVLYHARRGWKLSYVGILLLCAACPATAAYFPNHPRTDTLICIGLVLVMYLATTGRLNFLANGVLLFLGSISYSLYLTHYWVGNLSLRQLDRWHVPEGVSFVIALTLCLIVGTVVNRLIERPGSLWLRDQLQRRFAPRVPAIPPLTSAQDGQFGGRFYPEPAAPVPV